MAAVELDLQRERKALGTNADDYKVIISWLTV